MFIYLTTNKINNKKYIGKHNGKDPSYLGSGSLLRRAIRKYGKDAFERTVLEYGSESELDALEKKWIVTYDAVTDPQFYNITEGGTGGNTLKNLSSYKLKKRKEKLQKTLSKHSDKKVAELSKIRSDNTKKNRSDADLELKRQNSLYKTMQGKDTQWKRDRYKSQSGENHYGARKVITPLGNFTTALAASKEYHVCLGTVINRCNNINSKFKEWQFQDE